MRADRFRCRATVGFGGFFGGGGGPAAGFGEPPRRPKERLEVAAGFSLAQAEISLPHAVPTDVEDGIESRSPGFIGTPNYAAGIADIDSRFVRLAPGYGLPIPRGFLGDTSA